MSQNHDTKTVSEQQQQQHILDVEEITRLSGELRACHNAYIRQEKSMIKLSDTIKNLMGEIQELHTQISEQAPRLRAMEEILTAVRYINPN